MTDTAHDRYEAQVKAGNWAAYNDLHTDNLQKQLTGVLAERDALMAVVAAKQAQVDALLEERAALRAKLEWYFLNTRRTEPDTITFEVSAVTDDGAE